MRELWESVARRLDSESGSAGTLRLWSKLESAYHKGGIEALKELLEKLADSPEIGRE